MPEGDKNAIKADKRVGKAVSPVKTVTMTGVLTGLACVVTIYTRIPTPVLQGMFNLGDAVILVAAMMFGPKVGATVGAVGPALANILAGSYLFAPITFVVKGLEGLVVGLLARSFYHSSDARLEAGRPDARIGAGQPEARLGAERTEARIGAGQPDAHLGAEWPDARLGAERTDARIGAELPDVRLGAERPEAEPVVSLGEAAKAGARASARAGARASARAGTKAGEKARANARLKLPSALIMSAGAAIMVIGYFLAEAFVLGFVNPAFGIAAAITELPINIVQGIACVLIAKIALEALKRTRRAK